MALVCFMLVHITPGDPLDAMLPADASQEVVEQVRTAYGLDQPLPVQFGLWLSKGVTAISAIRWPRAGRSGPKSCAPSATR